MNKLIIQDHSYSHHSLDLPESHEMARKTREFNEKWDQFEKDGGLQRLDEDLERNKNRREQRNRELAELLSPEHELTLEDLDRARNYRMTDQERAEIEAERERWRIAHELHRDADELYKYHSGVLNKIGEEGERLHHRSKETLTEQESLVLNKYDYSKKESDKAKERRDELSLRIDDRTKQRNEELDDLLNQAKNAGKKSKLLKRDVDNYFKIYGDDYSKFLENEKEAPKHKIVDLCISRAS